METTITDTRRITASTSASGFTGSMEYPRKFFETGVPLGDPRLASTVTDASPAPPGAGHAFSIAAERFSALITSTVAWRPDLRWLIGGTMVVAEFKFTERNALRRWARGAAGTGRTLRTSLTQQSASRQVFDAIQSLYLSDNRPRDREIAARITTLHRHALLEGEQIRPASLVQFVAFFLNNAELRLPKITLTPDGALRARWIRGPEDFVAIEFTGQTLVKLVIEVPRDGGQTASHFASEPIDRVVSVSQAIGASFT